MEATIYEYPVFNVQKKSRIPSEHVPEDLKNEHWRSHYTTNNYLISLRDILKHNSDTDIISLFATNINGSIEVTNDSVKELVDYLLAINNWSITISSYSLADEWLVLAWENIDSLIINTEITDSNKNILIAYIKNTLRLPWTAYGAKVLLKPYPRLIPSEEDSCFEPNQSLQGINVADIAQALITDASAKENDRDRITPTHNND